LAEGRGLSKLWARRKIADAEVAQTMRALTADEANKTILALALEHQLVTRLTSLVAVDKTVTRPAGEPLKVSELPLNLPAGWDFEKVFGERSKLVPFTAPIERRAEERDGRTRVAMRGASTMAPTVSQPTGCRAACDRHGRRVEDDRGRRADGIRPDPRASPPKGLRLILLGKAISPRPPQGLARGARLSPRPRAFLLPRRR
jgi:hypothetical protein